MRQITPQKVFHKLKGDWWLWRRRCEREIFKCTYAGSWAL